MARDLARRAQASAQTQQGGDRRPATLQDQLWQMEKQFQLAMPTGSEAKQLIRDVLTCIRQTPKLAQCEPASIFGAAMTCAQLGLRPGVGALGHAYLLPFWDRKSGMQKAQLIIGYKGYAELAHRSGRVEAIMARVVYANDYFEVEYGAAEDKWVHRPCIDGPRGEPRLFYAVGRMVGGGYAITDPMTVADMEAHRDKFATAKTREGKVFGPWIDHFESMAEKTMVLRLLKLMPKSTEIQRALDNDGAVRVDLSPAAIDTPDYVDGEVTDEPAPPAEQIPDDAPQDAEVVPDAPDDPGPVDGPPADVQMASRKQLADLKKIRTAEKYDADLEWFGFLSDLLGEQITRESDITASHADRILATITDGGAQ